MFSSADPSAGTSSSQSSLLIGLSSCPCEGPSVASLTAGFDFSDGPGTTNIIYFNDSNTKRIKLTRRACTISHFIEVALGFLMVSLLFLVTTSTYFFPAPVQLTAADHSSVFFSFDVSTV